MGAGAGTELKDNRQKSAAQSREPLDLSFRERAVTFSVAAGCVVFILAMLVGAATTHGGGPREFRNALVLGIICGVTSWGATMRIVAETAGAIDRLIVRVRAAAKGEVDIAFDKGEREELPELVDSLDRLLGRVRSSLHSFHDLAMHDAVTGLPNRLHLRREAERQLYTATNDRTRAALIFIDLDRFKSVNDTLGHHIGDQLLGIVASRLSVVIDAECESGMHAERPLAARLGGDEFTVLVPDVACAEDARRLGRRLLRALSEPYEIAGHSVEIGASIGIALHSENSRGLTTLMRNADLAMYHAKARGRGQVQIFTPALAAQSEDRRLIEQELRRALEHEQFEIYLQPQITALDKRVTAAEALLRWRHPQGMRLPGDFIGIAEDSGIIVDIGEWTMRTVARTLAAWHRQHINTRIGLNISPRQLERADFFRMLEQAMEAAGAPWDLLDLGITETALVEGDSFLIEKFNRLRARGVKIAIDDFGIGYSNLAPPTSPTIDPLTIARSPLPELPPRGPAAPAP